MVSVYFLMFTVYLSLSLPSYDPGFASHRTDQSICDKWAVEQGANIGPNFPSASLTLNYGQNKMQSVNSIITAVPP